MPEGSPNIEEYKLALGEMVIHWARLEEGYFTLTHTMLGDISFAGSSFLQTELDLRAQCRLQKALAVDANHDVLRDHIIRLADYIDNEMRPARNRFVHDPVSVYSDDGIIRARYETKIQKPQSRKLTVRYVSFERASAVELRLLTRCIDAAEVYTGAILRVTEAEQFGDPVADPTALERTASALASAIAEYRAADRSLSDI